MPQAPPALSLLQSQTAPPTNNLLLFPFFLSPTLCSPRSAAGGLLPSSSRSVQQLLLFYRGCSPLLASSPRPSSLRRHAPFARLVSTSSTQACTPYAVVSRYFITCPSSLLRQYLSLATLCSFVINRHRLWRRTHSDLLTAWSPSLPPSSDHNSDL